MLALSDQCPAVLRDTTADHQLKRQAALVSFADHHQLRTQLALTNHGRMIASLVGKVADRVLDSVWANVAVESVDLQVPRSVRFGVPERILTHFPTVT